MSNKFFLSLGSQPLANNYQKKYNIKQTRYNLNLYFNTKTKLVSISKRIPSKKMFNNKYPYRSSMSHTMKKSFKTLSKEIKQKFNPKLLLEIGSNDGALISNFKKKKVIGIEPCSNLANITKQMGYRVFNYYWNIRTANFLLKKKIHPDLIYSANTITHISNLNEVFNSISRVLSKNGILIIEDPSLLECIKKVAYDQFYNEHIYVFSALALNHILKIFKFELFNIKEINTHGGSIRYYIKRTSNTKIKINKSVRKFINKEINFGLGRFETYKNFAKKAINSKYKLLKILRKLKKKKIDIIGYGATAKACTVLNFCNIGNNYINFFIDTTPDKQNKYMPGKNIKIFKYNKSHLKKNTYIFLGAWNFKNEIFKKEKKFINMGGKFITHVPKPRII